MIQETRETVRRATRPEPAVVSRQSSPAPVSVVIPVKNEAANLRRCLAALTWAAEVFVVDSQSGDGTQRIAAELGATVVQFHFNGSYPKKKNWALENLPFQHDWVLIVDADEIVSPALAREIEERIAEDDADGYYINSNYFFLGRPIRHCGYSECWNLRLFKHQLGRYEKMIDQTNGRTGDNEVHEHIQLNGRARRLRNHLEHYAYPTVSTWVEKHNRYAVWEAAMQERFRSGAIPSSIGRGKRFKRWLKRWYLRLPARPLVRFVYAYFIRLGFLDGIPGFIFCVLLAFYDFLIWVNAYERNLARDGRAHPGVDGI